MATQSEAGCVSAPEQRGWFVYLLALGDCSAFKVGFTANPLQRIYGFSQRHFQRFDLQQSRLLRFEHSAAARALERRLKRELADHRCDPPPWVPAVAGGHTEWFSAAHFCDAHEARQRRAVATGCSHCVNAFDLLRADLTRRTSQLELTRAWLLHAKQ